LWAGLHFYVAAPEDGRTPALSLIPLSSQYERRPASHAAANSRILEAMLSVFATNYSPSVQVTLFQMGEAALKLVPEVSEITLRMPNKHCLLVNLAPFGMENRNELFLPTDEPHGQIEGTVTRG
jgi:urate oxidase